LRDSAGFSPDFALASPKGAAESPGPAGRAIPILAHPHRAPTLPT
jgi:hypothetical protein